MKHQAAYSLLVLSGKPEPTQAEVETLLKNCGVSVDKGDLDQFFKCLGGRKAHELISEGKDKLISMPAVGCGGGAPAAAGNAGGAAAEAPKEEKKEEAEDVDMGGLFGDEDDY